MSFPSYSDSPRNSTNYLGQNYSFIPRYVRQRNPTTADIRPKENQGYYPIGSIWLNTVGLDIWILADITSSGGVTIGRWVLIANSLITGPLLTLSDNTGTVVQPSTDISTPPGNIQFLAGSGISITAGTNTLTITNTATASNFAPDTGTNPVSGSTVTFTNTSILATGTLTNAIRSNGTGVSTIGYQLQYAGSNAGSSTGSKWGVAQFDSNQFSVASGFVQLAGGTTAPILGVTPDAHTAPGTTPVVPNASGNIVLEGGVTFATNTQANPIRTNSLAANTIDLQIQLAGSNAAVSTANKFGVCQFDSNSFTVTNGFVALAAGGTDIQTLTGNSGGAISPTAGNINTVGTGSITIAGAGSTLTTQLTGLTNHAIQIGAGTATLTQLSLGSTGQVLQSNGAGDPSWSTPTYPSASGTTGVILRSDGTNNIYTTATYPATTTINQILYSSAANTITGLATANNGVLTTGATGTPVITQLSSNGQIIIGSGAGAPAAGTITAGTGVTVTNGANSITIAVTNGAAVTQFVLDAATTPISPSSGQVTLTGGQVATGVVGANVIRTRGNTGSSCTIEIQRSTVSAGSNSALNGVCHFNSTQFSVDTNGYVQAIAIGTFPWTDEGGNFNASSNNGYFCTALLTATLPGSPAQGDIVRIVCDTASVVTVTANTGQKIRIGNSISALAGTAASTRQGDSIELVYRSSSAVWYAFGSPTGTWTVT